MAHPVTWGCHSLRCVAHPVTWGCHSLRWQILSHWGCHSLRWHILSYGGTFHLCCRSCHMVFFCCITWGVVHVCGKSCYIGGVIHLLFSCVGSRTVIIISFGDLEPHSSSSCCCHSVTYYFPSAGWICWQCSYCSVLWHDLWENNNATTLLILQHTPTDHIATKNIWCSTCRCLTCWRQSLRQVLDEDKERPRERWVKTKRDKDIDRWR